MTQEETNSSAAKVSVVVPAYNAAGVITSCVKALQEQDSSPPYEIIVVDDGSSDNTADLAEESGAQVIRHTERRGAAAARNSGIGAAAGDIICFTDADCMPKENWIQQILRPFANQEIIGAKGTYATKQREMVARFVQIEYEDKYDLLLTQERINFIDTYSAAYRRQVLLANNGFDEQIFYVEDQELSFRLAARGYQMVFEPPAIVFWSFAILSLGLIVRVLFPLFNMDLYVYWIAISQVLWMTSFAIFVYVFAPILLTARVDGRDG